MSLPGPNSPAEITQAALIALGLGSEPPTGSIAGTGDWPVYASSEPNAPDNCLVAYDGVNQYDGRGMPDGRVWMHYGVMVKIRSTDHLTGAQKAWQVFYMLSEGVGGKAGNLSVVIDSYTYLISAFVKLKGPLVLGTESPNSKRRAFTINALLALGGEPTNMGPLLRAMPVGKS